MTRFRCDLHIHSCLSPCGDDEATPASIAGMAKLNGLDVAALTDHNACGNCPAFFRACEAYGVTPVAGMELTTAEDIHLVCLFPTLADAMRFESAVREKRIPVKNRPEIFGRQLVMNENDETVGEEAHLLINATLLSLSEAAALARSFGGAAFPAHIDRESNGLLAVLGGFPTEPAFSAAELHDRGNIPAYMAQYGLSGKRIVTSSDAHRLIDVAEGENACELTLDADANDAQAVRDALIRYLGGGDAAERKNA